MNKQKIVILLCWSLLFSGPFCFLNKTWALTSLRTTVSGGVGQDIDKQKRFTALIDWQLNHTSQQGIETDLDLGLNNDLVQGQWGFYPYQATIQVPFSHGLQGAPYRFSRVLLGRQFFNEGFEVGILDGLQAPIYWSKTGGVWLTGGGLRLVEKDELKFDAYLYGGSVFQKLWGTTFRAGALHKSRSGSGTDFLHAAVSRAWDAIPLQPTASIKGQWDVRNIRTVHQYVGEVQVSPTESTLLTADVMRREARRYDSGEGEFLYSLFAIEPEVVAGGSFVWFPRWNMKLGTSGRRVSYRSRAGRELGFEQEVFCEFRFGASTLRPSLTYLHQTKGVYDLGMRYMQGLSHFMNLDVEVDAARIEKINGIQGWAYHSRGGLQFNPLPNLVARVLLEIERNHFFLIDTRAVIYASHFYF